MLGFSGTRLQINSRIGKKNSLEVVWVLVSPPAPINGISKFICVCIYSPPHSRLDSVLLDHLRFNFSSLTARHPGAGICIGGDINNLDVTMLCDTFPDLVNMVASPTRGARILDVLISNLHLGYDKAVILPPIQPDVEGVGRPSDHSVAVAKPNTNPALRTGFSKTEVRKRRVMTASNLAKLGLFLLSFNWICLSQVVGTDRKLDMVNRVSLFSIFFDNNSAQEICHSNWYKNMFPKISEFSYTGFLSQIHVENLAEPYLGSKN